MSKLRFFGGVMISMIGLVLASFVQEKDPIKYMQVPTIDSSAADEPSIEVTLEDTLTHEIIFLRKTKEDIPLYYFKKVNGEVCYDEECRLLDIVVYWNITGRYLGFELPQGEFLSKHDHDPFSENEYQQLHSLLADETLPLDKISFEELLAQPKQEEEGVDGTTGATSKDIAGMVVKGAAYTSYKLWNTVNGSTMDVVSALTEKQLTPSLQYRILQSQDVTDKLWALDRLGAVNILTPQLENILFELITSADFYLAYSAINALQSMHLKSADFQNRLFSHYQNANHSLQAAIIKKLMDAPFLSSEIIQSARGLLPQLNGQQLADLLQLYTRHNIADLETCTAVAKIIKNDNKYISKKAYNFLIGLQIEDDNITELLKAYKEND